MPKESQVPRDSFPELVKPILGLTVTHPWRGYGSAIFLEFGPLTRILRHRQRPGHDLKGVASLTIEFSWRIEGSSSIEAGSFSDDDNMNSAIQSTKGNRVTDVSLFGALPEITVALDTDRTVRSFMTTDGDPAWTLFLPDGSWLCVRDGQIVREWSTPALP